MPAPGAELRSAAASPSPMEPSLWARSSQRHQHAGLAAERSGLRIPVIFGTVRLGKRPGVSSNVRVKGEAAGLVSLWSCQRRLHYNFSNKSVCSLSSKRRYTKWCPSRWPGFCLFRGARLSPEKGQSQGAVRCFLTKPLSALQEEGFKARRPASLLAHPPAGRFSQRKRADTDPGVTVV